MEAQPCRTDGSISPRLFIDAYLGYFLANNRKIVDGMFRENVDIFYEVLSKNVIRSVVNSV